MFTAKGRGKEGEEEALKEARSEKKKKKGLVKRGGGGVCGRKDEKGKR